MHTSPYTFAFEHKIADLKALQLQVIMSSILYWSTSYLQSKNLLSSQPGKLWVAWNFPFQGLTPRTKSHKIYRKKSKEIMKEKHQIFKDKDIPQYHTCYFSWKIKANCLIHVILQRCSQILATSILCYTKLFWLHLAMAFHT